MQRSKRVQVIVAVLVCFGLIIIAILLGLRGGGSPKGGKTPSKDVLSVVQKYIQAREDSVGAGQASPTSWIDSVKDITTSGWFAKLQPKGDPSTGSTPYNYTFAHQNNYEAKANLSSCIWDDILTEPSDAKGVVLCNLEDETINKSNGESIAASSLPFGWAAVGKQMPPQLIVVHQGSKWLIDGDITGQAQ